jgi:hypothetical protein
LLLITEESYTAANEADIAQAESETTDEETDDGTRRANTDEDFYTKVVTGDNTLEITDQGSGSALPTLYLAFVDMYEQIVGDESER